jgi:hypothetical protein
MSKKTPICRKCKKVCKEQVDSNPTWFGKYRNADLIEAICIDCWKKGENWEKDRNKNER